MKKLSRQQLKPPAAKLDEDKVRCILRSDDDTFVLARRYGVCARTIEEVRKGKTWRHVR